MQDTYLDNISPVKYLSAKHVGVILHFLHGLSNVLRTRVCDPERRHIYIIVQEIFQFKCFRIL